MQVIWLCLIVVPFWFNIHNLINVLGRVICFLKHKNKKKSNVILNYMPKCTPYKNCGFSKYRYNNNNKIALMLEGNALQNLKPWTDDIRILYA